MCVFGGVILRVILNDSNANGGSVSGGFSASFLIVVAVGIVICWLSGFLLYGFGELIDQTQEINAKLSFVKNNSDVKEWR